MFPPLYCVGENMKDTTPVKHIVIFLVLIIIYIKYH